MESLGEIVQGDGVDLVIRGNSLVDFSLAGLSVWLTVKALHGYETCPDSLAKIRKSKEDGHITMDPTNNTRAFVTINGTDTAKLPVGDYIFDVKIRKNVDPSGPRTLARGTFSIVAAVTKAIV
jgi:hypothetical protein